MDSTSSISSCLPHINAFLASVCVEIINVLEIPSAQQVVLFLTVQESQKNVDGTQKGEKSTTPTQSDANQPNLNFDENKKSLIRHSIKNGNGRLVVRIWKGSARWWNLNSNELSSFIEVARSEVSGYRIAKSAIEKYNWHCEKVGQEKDNGDARIDVQANWPKTQVTIPDVLYFSHDNIDHNGIRECNSKTQLSKKTNLELDYNSPLVFPWGIFEYVGKDSSCFIDNNWVYNDEFSSKMIKVRHEFGFDEPHPRHGRVSVEHSLEYAMNVLESVILPLHCPFFLSSFSSLPSELSGLHNTNQVENRQRKVSRIKSQKLNNNVDFPLDKTFSPESRESRLFLNHTEPYRYKDMILLYQNAVGRLRKSFDLRQENQSTSNNEKMTLVIDILEQCINTLYSESNAIREISDCWIVPPVICHMDLQPQNMILRVPNKAEIISGVEQSPVPSVASVLDWEEASYADPRFELLLLCRKVAANRFQADYLWNHYSESIRNKFALERNIFGPIEPWLKLETVHSLTTLILQATNLVGGGRNPWETKPDLWSKINREFSRLSALGWTFCRKSI